MSNTDTSVFQSTAPFVNGGSPNTDGNTGSHAPVIEQAKQQAQKVVEQTQQKAGEVLDQAKVQTMSWAEDRKQDMAQSLSDVAVAVLQTGESLRGQSPSNSKVAEVTDRAAEITDRAASYLRDTSVDQMIGEVEGFGRSEPVLFLVGAAALGFIAARFLKSSGRNAQIAAGYNPDRSLPVPINEQNVGVGNNYDATSPAGYAGPLAGKSPW